MYQYVFLESRSTAPSVNNNWTNTHWSTGRILTSTNNVYNARISYDSTTGYVNVVSGRTYNISICLYPRNNVANYMRIRLMNTTTGVPLFGNTDTTLSDAFIVTASHNAINEPCVNSFTTMYRPTSSH